MRVRVRGRRAAQALSQERVPLLAHLEVLLARVAVHELDRVEIDGARVSVRRGHEQRVVGGCLERELGIGCAPGAAEVRQVRLVVALAALLSHRVIELHDARAVDAAQLGVELGERTAPGSAERPGGARSARYGIGQAFEWPSVHGACSLGALLVASTPWITRMRSPTPSAASAGPNAPRWS